MTVENFAEEIVRQAELVEALGMLNMAGKPYPERVALMAEYEAAKAHLEALRVRQVRALYLEMMSGGTSPPFSIDLTEPE